MTALTEFVELKRRGRVAVITVNNPPNNVLSHGVRKGLKDGVVAASGDPAVSAMVITCAGRTFIAGGDTAEFVRPPQEPGLHEVLDLIEESSKPVVAAIHGTALLGGFEVILACHYRVSVRTARCGLPGVTMGLLPGAGGTQRLPRHPRPPPPEPLQPCRLPVPSHPSCPCAAVRAGGLPAASCAGQPLARGVRAAPRRGQQRAGWQQGGMGWADAVGGKGRLIFLSPWLWRNKHLLKTPRYAYGPTGRRYRLLDAQEMRTIRDNKRFTFKGIVKWMKAA